MLTKKYQKCTPGGKRLSQGIHLFTRIGKFWFIYFHVFITDSFETSYNIY